MCIGLALDFAEAAASLGRENVNPGWLLYRLLRGSREEALHARVVAAIYGWDLCAQRVAIVVAMPPAQRSLLAADPMDAIERLLGASARTTPFGQLDDGQWVVLPEYESRQARARVRQLAESLLAHLGTPEMHVGVGEPHPSVAPVLAALPGVRDVRRDDSHLHLSTSELHLTVPALLDLLNRQRATLSQLGTHSATLEDVFVTLTGRQLRDE